MNREQPGPSQGQGRVGTLSRVLSCSAVPLQPPGTAKHSWPPAAASGTFHPWCSQGQVPAQLILRDTVFLLTVSSLPALHATNRLRPPACHGGASATPPRLPRQRAAGLFQLPGDA